MTTCKQCGKGILGNKKFCNSSCAGKYNNSHRIRKPWTKEQKQAITKQRFCKYCGKEITKRHVCPDCRPFALKAPLLRKFAFSGNLQEQYQEMVKLLVFLYEVEQKSLPDIHKITGVWGQTSYPILKKAGCHMRSLREGEHLAVLQGKTQIGNKTRPRYKTGYHSTWEGKRIFYRSSYELRYAEQLDSQQVPYDVEALRIEYFDTKEGKRRVAVPDFFLPNTNELVEIKSSWTYDEQNMKDRFKAYKKAGYKPRLFVEERETYLKN